MSTKLYGTPIDSKLVDQLNYRKENLKYKSKNAAELMLDNNRGAYVSLVSGATQVFYKNEDLLIDTSRYPDLKETEKVQLSNTLAQGNVLFGGTLYQKQLQGSTPEYANFSLHQRGGISFNSGFDELGNKSSYDLSETYGFRPMMGITDLTINYKSSFGSIREAVIKIQANSPEQLSILDKLYFRPGYTMLLEWGNNMYLDAQGVLSSFYTTFARDFLQFDADIDKVKEDILLYREDTGFNYDGMIGKVTNFDWAYQSTGVYNCSVKLISEGDLIEGIKTTYAKPKEYFTDEFNGNNQNDTGDTYDDKFLEILTAFKNDLLHEKYLKLLANKGVKIPRVYKTTYDKTTDTENPRASSDRGHAMFHITLKDVLELLNKFILEDEDTGSSKLRFNTDPKASTMVTFVGHISGNPKTCVMPYRSGRAGGLSNTPTELDLYLVNSEAELLNVIRKSPKEIDAPDDSPLKILINIDEIISIQTRLVEAEAKDKSAEAKVSKFMNTLLKNISRDLGGINKLRILYDKDTTSHIIVDENMPSAIDEGDFEIPEIDVVGLGSFATDVSIESKVSPSMVNSLAIAATAQGTSLNDSISPLLKYNKGITDRFNIKSISDQEDQDKDKTHPVKKKFEESLDAGAGALGKAYRRVKQGIYSNQLFSSTILPHRRLMNALHDYIQLGLRGEGKKIPYTALIPIELSLGLRGITGFKCGQAFTISPEVLPERYREKVAFIVTGIDHKIDSKNMWTTALNTTMKMLPSDERVALGSDFYDIKAVSKDSLINAINYDPPENGSFSPTPTGEPWSAAFISYCMKKGDGSFPGDTAHTGYLEKVRTGHTDRYEILNASITKPKVGDIIIQGRAESGYLRFFGVPYAGSSHGDIVVKLVGDENKPTAVQAIGGNVGDTVAKKVIKLNPKYYNFADVGGGPRVKIGTVEVGQNEYTVIIRPKSDSGVNIPKIIETCELEWQKWRPEPKVFKPLEAANAADIETRANQTDARGEELFERLRLYWEAAGVNEFERDS
tara:strand:+ start:134 stop:3178 length:3045 start_codon:yes stop_codon:yes gene_type:complete